MMSAAGGGGVDVDEVFSTYLYNGTGADLTIANGVDLSGEGGMVWLKGRIQYSDNFIYDTERGVGNNVRTNKTTAQQTRTDDLKAFNSNGFSIGDYSEINTNYSSGGVGYNYASWTFRKAPKFFDVVTYTGNGTAGRTVSHNLGAVPGMIIVKCTNQSGRNWPVYHRGVSPVSGNSEDYITYLDVTNASQTDTMWNNTKPTSSSFQVGAGNDSNGLNLTYVAYLFAHNNNDGEFGPNSDQDIIKCGEVGTFDNTVNLGFEPQWILFRRTNGTSDWYMYDTMRGLTYNFNGVATLLANKTDPESDTGGITPITNGFISNLTGSYIYTAIRRGPLNPPTAGTEVFAIDTKTTPEPAYNSGFVVDMAIQRNISAATSNSTTSRLLQKKRLLTDSTSAEENSVTFMFDYNTGWSSDAGFNDANQHSWMWKRAPGYFDVVAYTGTNVARTVSHNLGVAPEMMWVKRRNTTGEWPVYHKDLSLGNRGIVLQGSTGTYASEYWNNTNPTSTTFPLGAGDSSTNASGSTYIAYLFATVSGVSKVGSYTGNGSSQTINCGFTSGARFIIIKRTDSTGDWYFWDTERGIVAGNDPHMSLNSTSGNVTSDDSVDPANSGFIVNQVSATNINVSSATYIFYAIA